MSNARNNFSVMFGRFPLNGKRGSSLKKKKLKYYCPISFRPVSYKIFLRLLYNSMLKFFTESDLMSHNLSEFTPSDTCTNQPLLIVH